MILTINRYKIECYFDNTIDDYLNFEKQVKNLLKKKSKYLLTFQNNMQKIFEYLSKNYACDEFIFEYLYNEIKNKNYDNIINLVNKKDVDIEKIIEL